MWSDTWSWKGEYVEKLIITQRFRERSTGEREREGGQFYHVTQQRAMLRDHLQSRLCVYFPNESPRCSLAASLLHFPTPNIN
jgi:hypothetical protein